MNFSLVTGDFTRVSAALLVLPLFEDELGDPAPSILHACDTAMGEKLLSGVAQEGFKGKADQSALVHTLGQLPFERVLLLGLGRRDRFQPEVLRLATGRAAKAALKVKAQRLLVALPLVSGGLDVQVRAAVEGFVLGAYRFTRYKSRAADEKPSPLTSVQLLLPEGKQQTSAEEQALQLGNQVAEAANWARDLVNEPANVVTPTRLAEAARALAKKSGLKITVTGRKDILRLKMGMFAAVSQGSAEEPQLIQVSYLPKNAAQAQKPALALVGKAITFDSGGLSLKTADGMVDMKTDMAGSAAVLGAMSVIASLKPPFPVHAFIGACENMPSGTAYRPGDVLTSRLGKTVEITNTDAEGRLVLGDILTWACEQKPFAVVDLATLTGACMVALGNYIVGAFGVHEETMAQVLEAGRTAGEALWRLPVSELQKDALRSEIADMKNSGERWAGATNAALFLKEFVGETPWVHLDIAGPSQSPKERGYYNKGATGVGVRTLVEYVRALTQDSERSRDEEATQAKGRRTKASKAAR